MNPFPLNFWLFITCKSAQIFSNDIKFKVDHTPLVECVKIGVFVGIRNNGNLKGIVL